MPLSGLVGTRDQEERIGHCQKIRGLSGRDENGVRSLITGPETMLRAARETVRGCVRFLAREENTVNMRSRSSVGLAAAIVFGVLAPAPLFSQGAGDGPGAQDNRPWGDKMHGRCDTNKDGKVTWDEYRACHEARFDKLDTQHQGKVTLDEVKAHARNPAQAQAMFERIDTGHTGVVTREQYDTWLHKRFDSLDTNHDGALTPDEMRQGRHHGPAGGPGGGSGGGTGQGGTGSSQ